MELNVNKINLLLAEQKMTKKMLAERSGVLAQNISTVIKRGKCSPLIAGKLANGFGVSVAEIVITSSAALERKKLPTE